MFLWVGAEQEYMKMGEQNVIPWEKFHERISVFLWSRIIFWEWQKISVCWWEQHLNKKLRSKLGEGIEEKIFVVGEFKIWALGKSQSGFANLLSSRVRIRRELSPGEKWVITVLSAIVQEVSGRDQELERIPARSWSHCRIQDSVLPGKH